MREGNAQGGLFNNMEKGKRFSAIRELVEVLKKDLDEDLTIQQAYLQGFGDGYSLVKISKNKLDQVEEKCRTIQQAYIMGVRHGFQTSKDGA